jgi:sarcosine oxidase, subunit gamma
VSLPTQPNTTTHGAAWTALWMGPTSWLLVARQPDVDVAPADAFITTRDALNAQSGALFDVSAARSGFVVRGPHAPTVLGKLCPIDLDVSGFPAGGCAQTLLGHVNAMIYRPDAGSGFAVLVARSLWRDAWQSLCTAAAPVGYDVVPSVAFADLGAPLSR